MKTFNTTQKNTGFPLSVIQANLNSEKSIEAAEKHVLELLNQGYDVSQSYGGWDSWNIVLINTEAKQ